MIKFLFIYINNGMLYHTVLFFLLFLLKN